MHRVKRKLEKELKEAPEDKSLKRTRSSKGDASKSKAEDDKYPKGGGAINSKKRGKTDNKNLKNVSAKASKGTRIASTVQKPKKDGKYQNNNATLLISVDYDSLNDDQVDLDTQGDDFEDELKHNVSAEVHHDGIETTVAADEADFIDLNDEASDLDLERGEVTLGNRSHERGQSHDVNKSAATTVEPQSSKAEKYNKFRKDPEFNKFIDGMIEDRIKLKEERMKLAQEREELEKERA